MLSDLIILGCAPFLHSVRMQKLSAQRQFPLLGQSSDVPTWLPDVHRPRLGHVLVPCSMFPEAPFSDVVQTARASVLQVHTGSS